MINLYKNLSKLIQAIINLSFFIQIALMILVFLVTAQWFFHLVGSNLFDFVEPISVVISDFIKTFHNNEIVMGGVNIDGSILLFDIIAVFVVFVITKSKFYLYKLIEKTDYALMVEKRKYEKRMNEELQKEADALIQKYNRAAILVTFEAKNTLTDNLWDGDPNAGVREKVDEALKILYATIKSTPQCTFAKTAGRLAIIIESINVINDVFVVLEQSLKRIKNNMKAQNWEINSLVAVDSFASQSEFGSKIYPLLDKLTSLAPKNNIVCLGSFQLRYQLLKEQTYQFIKIGDYDIERDGNLSSLFKLVKKN